MSVLVFCQFGYNNFYNVCLYTLYLLHYKYETLLIPWLLSFWLRVIMHPLLKKQKRGYFGFTWSSHWTNWDKTPKIASVHPFIYLFIQWETGTIEKNIWPITKKIHIDVKIHQWWKLTSLHPPSQPIPGNVTKLIKLNLFILVHVYIYLKEESWLTVNLRAEQQRLAKVHC